MSESEIGMMLSILSIIPVVFMFACLWTYYQRCSECGKVKGWFECHDD